MHEFITNFKLLTGHSPFPWQERLFESFCAGDIPKSCSLPTGLGKTSVIAIWLLAIAQSPSKLPRRLIYVVNRRTVVDQATSEVEKLRRNLTTASELADLKSQLHGLCTLTTSTPLAISTLRGQHADNAEWSADPARPAAILGTVDMIGSRLLFSGYGRGFKARPLHAAFLGQDALLIHDEAHLEPAFQQLVESIVAEQVKRQEFRRLQVMELTATSRGGVTQFFLDSRDHENPIVKSRIEARKGLRFHEVENDKAVADEVAHQALELKGSGAAVLVYLRTIEDLSKVETVLRKEVTIRQSICMLTGTLRGLERDSLATGNAVFARFDPSPAVLPQTGTVYLLCTSAGEVGVNISADHVVCDLSTFDSTAQRLGRVNRFGTGNAEVHVVHPGFRKPKAADNANRDEPAESAYVEPESLSVLDQARLRTLWLLQRLPIREDGHRDASPRALDSLDATERKSAFSPQPQILSTTDVLLDAWAMTSIRGELPGRPPVGPWLHGVADWQPAETQVAWRKEVELLTGDLLEKYAPEDLLEDYPIKPHEILRDRTQRIQQNLELIAVRHPDAPVWIVSAESNVRVDIMRNLVRRDKQNKFIVSLEDCQVLLSPEVGGLADGILKGDVAVQGGLTYDVADEWYGEGFQLRRCRLVNDEEFPVNVAKGMRLVRTLEIPTAADDIEVEDNTDSFVKRWYWYVQPLSADDDGSRAAQREQELHEHLTTATGWAIRLSEKLQLGETESNAVLLASKWHDRGKNRLIWQRAIGNKEYPVKVLAKSGAKRARMVDMSPYRHEFGSILEILDDEAFRSLDDSVKELTLHLVAAHHGRARPHFTLRESYDPQCRETVAVQYARSVPSNFAKLQRKYGRWGLAYLESIVRAVDIIASQNNDNEASAPTRDVTVEVER